MRWEDERYVRLYTRDTADWMGLSWDAQALMMQLIRKVDRAGALPLGRHGKRAVAIVLGQVSLWERIAPALEELLADGCVRISGDCLFIPNFLVAQEAVQSDAQRKRDQREREQARLLAAALPVTFRDAAVTFRDEMSRDVTSGHAESRAVTPSVPTHPVPTHPDTSVGAFAPLVGVGPVGALSGTRVPVVEDGAEPEKRKPGGKKPRIAASPESRRVFEHWKRVMGKNGNTEFDDKRRKAVQARLDGGYSPEDLILAVDGCAVTPHNIGQNENGQRYDDLELICRNAGQVDRFMSNARSPPKPTGSAKGRATDAEKDWSGFAPSQDSDELFEEAI